MEFGKLKFAYNKVYIPLFLNPVRAGFPSPAEDFKEKDLDLNEYLIQHPASTYMVRVKGDSMIDLGYYPGDILIVDKSKIPVNGSLIIAGIDYEFTFKKYIKEGDKIKLIPANKKYQPIVITPETNFEVWGVVIHSIHHPPKNEYRSS